MQITITDDDGIVLEELEIDEAEQAKQSGETGNQLASAIISHIENRFEIID